MSSSSRIRAAVRRVRPPVAPEEPRIYTLHDETRRDEFAYLGKPDDPRTRKYIADENGYFDACFASITQYRKTLYDELTQRFIEDDVSVPETIGGYSYYTRVAAGCQYPIHCRRPVAGGEEEVCLDENQLARPGSHNEVAVVSVCPRQERVACSVDWSGDERYEILVATLPGGKPIRCVSGAGDSLAWSGDGRQLLYTGTDGNGRPESVWMYDPDDGAHRRIYLETDPAFHVNVWLSRSREWLFIDCASNTTSETLVVPASSPGANPVVLIPRKDDVEYTVDHYEDRFLVLTNDEAESFRLVSIPVSSGIADGARELIPADDQVTLEFVDVYRRHWVIGELRDGIRHVAVIDPESGLRRYLPGSGILSYLDVEDLFDHDVSYVRYEHSTPVSPHTVYDFDVATGRSEWRKCSTPPDYDQSAYVCERLEAPSGDVRVPLSLIYRRDALRGDGGNPLLLNGYGAYEESVDVDFDSDLVSLLDRGVVYAAAHVRGGGDLGPAWHDAGRLSEKENSFADFLACAHYLVKGRYTGTGRIAAWGASAGGLLVAVAAQREPELFSSIVLEVPFLDVINTLLDPGLPLTEYDFDEFGNPAIEAHYRWMRAYSPYDNIRSRPLPPMLVTSALNDQRVGYWEALKWTARLRAARSDDNPLLLKVDPTGHLGQSGRYESAKETALVYTFLLDMWGLLPEQ
jgi:oligopeptidase B